MKPSLVLLGTATAMSLLANVLAASAYTDVGSETALKSSIEALTSQGVVEGYADGTFRPAARVNRAEFLKALMKASGRVVSVETIDRHQCFTDFKGTEQWYWAYACAAKEQGMIHGYPDGSFGGTKNINVAEAVKMSVLAWNVPLPQYFRAPDHWYDPYMDAAAGFSVFTLIPHTPSHVLLRGEMTALFYAFMGEGDYCAGRPIGESFLSPDGCNTCVCTENGAACTKMACVPPVENMKCISSNDCSSNQYCTVETGDCQSPCSPDADFCMDVCAGVCVRR